MFNPFRTEASEIAPGEAYKVYGTPAATMNDKDFQRKVGKGRAAAGSKGEQLVFNKLREKGGWAPADTPVFCSLKVPGKATDIDFAIVRGSKVLLIDAKMYRQDGGFFWNYGDRTHIRRGFGHYRNSKGETMTLSKSMVMAKDIISRNLPSGFTVEAMVVFTTDNYNPNAKMPTTWALKYPGNIAVCNDASAPRFINRFLGGQKRTTDTHNAERYLRSLVQ